MTQTLDTAAELLDLLATTATEPRADDQLEALTLAVAAGLPVLLWGEPGIGKTAALTQLADALDLPLTTVIASVHEPTDFSGLPVIGADPAVHGVPMAPPDWAVRLARCGRGLLFLDELSTAPPAVQAALLRLVLERRVGALRVESLPKLGVVMKRAQYFLTAGGCMADGLRFTQDTLLRNLIAAEQSLLPQPEMQQLSLFEPAGSLRSTQP